MKTQVSNKLFIYTRKPQDEYTPSLANSIHIAASQGEAQFEPLNRNYGILFAKATVNEQNVIQEKGLIKPYIFHLKSGGFGIAAIRVDHEGNRDEQSKGCIALWTTEDMIHFNDVGLLKLHDRLFVDEIICEFKENEQVYELCWLGSDDHCYMNQMTDLFEADSISTPIETEAYPRQRPLPALQGTEINSGNVIEVDEIKWNSICSYWTPVHNVDIQAPEGAHISSRSQLDELKAIAVYSDGSTALKKVRWKDGDIDFSKPGKYTVAGQVEQASCSFPLASGYADPVIMLWNDKYYYIATNDNKDDIGIYVREADTVEELFAPGYTEAIILDVDEEQGFVQTFWAPEFHWIGEELYILFAVSGTKWGPQCHMMKLKKGGNILKAADWETPIRVKRTNGAFLAEEGITLDMTYFKVDGSSYVVWSYREHIGTPLDSGSMIYIATVDEQNPTVLTSEPVLLTRPLYGWENIQRTINNEGPYPLITDDTVYITYSGGAACGYTYAIGLLSIPRGSDLLNAEAWHKASTPVLSYYNEAGVYGPGHNSFFQDKEGNTMIMYHGETEIVKFGTRCTAMHRVHFNQQGVPLFDVIGENDLKASLVNLEMEVEVGK